MSHISPGVVNLERYPGCQSYFENLYFDLKFDVDGSLYIYKVEMKFGIENLFLTERIITGDILRA